MAKYECKVCGYIYNEQHAGRPFEELTECPICNESKENFFALDSEGVAVEQKPAETLFEEKIENVAEAVVTEDVTTEATNNVVEDIKEVTEDIPHIVEEQSETPEFVVERRQEFWSPMGSRQETIIADAEEKEEVVDSSYTSRIENFYSSAEPVGKAHIISDEDEKEFKPLWNSTGGTVQRVIDPFGARSESLVKAENVGMVMPAEEPTVEEILGEEPEAVGEVNEAATEVVEEVFFAEAEETVEAVTEATAEEIAPEVVVEDIAEEVIPEVMAEDVVEEIIPETTEVATEEIADTVEEVIPEVTVEVVAESVSETIEEAIEPTTEVVEENVTARTVADEYFLDEEEDDDDFFSEVVMDHFMEEDPVAEAVAEEVVEEPVAEEIIEDVVEEPVAEAIIEEVVEEPVAEAIIEEVVEEPVAEAIIEEVVEEPVAEEIAEEVVEEPVAEEIIEDVVEEPVAEVIIEEVVEEPVAEVIAEEVVEEPVVEVITEEVIAEPDVEEIVETMEEPVAEADVVEEAPRIKAWSFLDDVLEAGTVVGAGVAGAAVVSAVAEESEEATEVKEEAEAAEETEETEATEEADVVETDAIDSYDYFTEEIRRAREVGGYTPLRVGEIDLSEKYEEEIEEAVEEVVEETAEEVVDEIAAEPEEAETYCNNLEKILILPAQLNPMPLPEAVEVDGKTVLGIGSDRPLVLDNPVFSTGAYNMVQYIPNSGLTSEDYQKADAIEIVVGKGNGIEKNINSKEDLRQVVNFLRLESDGCPIGIKLGAGRIERDLEFCIFAKPDYVVLNNFSVVPLPYALHRATKFLNTVQSDIDIVIALDGVKDAEELAKIIAMGADVIALRNQPSNLDEMITELKNHARVTGHYDVQDLNIKDLCTIDREIAEYTDIYHV